MSVINGIDYSQWSDKNAVRIAEQVDTDGVKGLQGKEIFNFTASAIENNMKQDEINDLLGISKTASDVKTRAAQTIKSQPVNPAFSNAVNYYNDNMSSYQRYQVTQDSYTKLEERLYNMEHSIDQAFIDSEAYNDIVIVPSWHYKYYPSFNDKLLNFDIEEIRRITSKDMEALHGLKDKIEYIIEDANGVQEHTEPKKTEYDIEALAQKYFGMSYEDFATKYKDELEFCKTVSVADLNSMTETQRFVYSKAKAYASEMLTITTNEAHTVNWDAGDRKVNETVKTSSDMITISDFEYEGITEDGLAKIQSGIMYKAFEEALVSKYRELNPTGVEEIKSETATKRPKKVVVNGQILIFHPDGSIYDEAGRQIK